jgi:glycosyltransferase involved in cell wall biosynthesis
VESIRDVLPRRVSWLFHRLFERIERYAIGRADAVNLVSPGFGDYFEPKYPGRRFTYFTNGIDDEFMDGLDAPSGTERPADRQVTVLYAGNLGEGQGLHTIVPDLAARLGSRFNFRIIGDGGRKHELERALTARNIRNVELIAPLSRPDLLNAYRNADVLFLHLNDYPAFARVLPSKLFEYAATGKPIWAGLGGYSARFASSEIENVAVFAPCDAEGAVRAFDGLSMTPAKRSAFIAKYARATISRRIAADIVDLARGPRS